ncbi:DNA-binding protein [Priestia megaterium]|uniref:DNA-binding protein n=1 Tax=Priestia megaterium TaxID=1404 RepID=UPI0027A5A211|nr:DNA-binding protein [Priestia megaterium]MEB4887654.1 DNA-binding protein [Priestia megaterium]WDC91263.1 DNA-binding protein [Priestia megaterium]
MREIEKYMTPLEASYLWGVPRETLKNKYSPSTLSKKRQEELNNMIDQGLVKFFKHPDRERKEWIISKQAMIKWFGDPKK